MVSVERFKKQILHVIGTVCKFTHFNSNISNNIKWTHKI